MKLKKAFTLAEAIMVMVILGIIATILISTMKPTEFKNRGFKVLAKKILGQIDTATTQILFNDSRDSDMKSLYDPEAADNTTTVSFRGNTTKARTLYAKYLVATREGITGDWCKQTEFSTSRMKLKDGSCLGLQKAASTDTIDTWIPGESAKVSVSGLQGVIYLDVNDAEEPNKFGLDQFTIPIDDNGIAY